MQGKRIGNMKKMSRSISNTSLLTLSGMCIIWFWFAWENYKNWWSTGKQIILDNTSDPYSLFTRTQYQFQQPSNLKNHYQRKNGVFVNQELHAGLNDIYWRKTREHTRKIWRGIGSNRSEMISKYPLIQLAHDTQIKPFQSMRISDDVVAYHELKDYYTIVVEVKSDGDNCWVPSLGVDDGLFSADKRMRLGLMFNLTSIRVYLLQWVNKLNLNRLPDFPLDRVGLESLAVLVMGVSRNTLDYWRPLTSLWWCMGDRKEHPSQ